MIVVFETNTYTIMKDSIYGFIFILCFFCVGYLAFTDDKEERDDYEEEEEYDPEIFYIEDNSTLHYLHIGNPCIKTEGCTRIEGEELLEHLKIDSICHICYEFATKKDSLTIHFESISGWHISNPIESYIKDNPNVKH